MSDIHPTAIISDSASLGEQVSVGAYSIIEDGAQVGDGCEIAAQAQIRAHSIIGSNCFIGSGALVGADPHFIGFDRSLKTWAELGEDNVIREYATIHRSIEEGGATKIGDDNFLMNGAHVGHDCIVGNHNVLANNVLLGGHVELGDRCFLGGGSVFHQFIRVGDYVMAQGLAGTSHDIPPFTMMAGINEIAGLNAVGIKRAGFSSEDRKEIKEVFRLVYRSNLNLSQSLEKLAENEWGEAAGKLVNFLNSDSKKGFCLKLHK